MQGPDALGPVIGQLEGFEAPAGAWEREILAARIKDYQTSWLDDRCRSGRLAWMRLRSHSRSGAARRTGPVKSTPITLLPRQYAATWRTVCRNEVIALRPHAQMVAEHIRQHGASFFEDNSPST